MKLLRVRELANIAGVSVRTLHYYEEIGLLQSERTESGHRRYGKAAVEQLQQIRSLQQLGFSLTEIKSVLGDQSVSPEKIIADHLVQIKAQRTALTQLEKKLRHLIRLLQSGHNNKSEALKVLLETLEAMKMYDKHLTTEQQQQINALHKNAGDAATRWQAALDGLRGEMKAGSDPSNPKVQKLAKDWHDAATAFMPAGDEAAHKGVMQLLHDEPKARQDHGLDDALFTYIGKSLAPDEHSEK